jgi:RNA polymerase sigma factor (sigma-70 family)
MNDGPGTLTEEEANQLVVEHIGWTESIARSVARSWNLDWRLDGLDGAAMEALIYCSRRFDPARGVPFKGYARRRIHEASTEAARKSRGWKRTSKSMSSEESTARDISAKLLNIFPELREGNPAGDSEDTRSGLRQVLTAAALISSTADTTSPNQEEVLDYKKTVNLIQQMDVLHQHILFEVYWEGKSLREIAGQWNTEPLNIIREHQSLLGFLQKSMTASRQRISVPKIRPGLRALAEQFAAEDKPSPFAKVESAG